MIKKKFTFDTKDKVIMNIDMHPKYNLFACGAESFCQTYSISHKRIDMLNETQSDFSKNEDDRLQKRVKFIPDIPENLESEERSYVVTCGVDGFLRIWTFPKLKMIKEVKVHDQEIVDLDISRHYIVVMTKKSAKIFLLKKTSADDNIDFDLEMVKSFTATEKYNYRDCVFTKDEKHLYITEYLPQQCSRIQVFSTSDWNLLRSKQIKLKGEHHTIFTIHPSKDVFALGTTEGTLLVFESNSMKNIMKCKPHNFIITGLHFHDSSDDQYCTILSCSADNTVVATKVPLKSGRNWIKMMSLVFLIVIISILIEMYRENILNVYYDWKNQPDKSV